MQRITQHMHRVVLPWDHYTAQQVFWKTCLWYEYILSTVPCTPSSEYTAIWCTVEATDIVTVCSSSPPPREYVILWVSTVDRDCLSGCCTSNTNTGTHVQWLLKTNNIHWNPVIKQPQSCKTVNNKGHHWKLFVVYSWSHASRPS